MMHAKMTKVSFVGSAAIEVSWFIYRKKQIEQETTHFDLVIKPPS